MPIWVETILEIIKITVPALIVFLTIYYLMKQYNEQQYQLKMLEFKQKQQDKTLPLRLQAYERLSMFCERISLSNLVFRMRQENMTAKDLKIAMILAIQQEFEHNLSQQVYVSNDLWQIINIAKNETMAIINLLANGLAADAGSSELSQAIFKYLDEKEIGAIDQAKVAIKKEIGVLM